MTAKEKQYRIHTRKFLKLKQEEVYAEQCLALNNNMNQKEFSIHTFYPHPASIDGK